MSPAGRPSVWRPFLVALARAVNTGFFLLTSLYCLLTYSSFAYQQFIRPHLVNWLSGFVVWHHLAFWLMLVMTTWTLLPELRDRRSRLVGAGYLAASALVGVVLLVRPVLPQVENNGRGLVLALVALVPPVWLAGFDHRRYRLAADLEPSSDARVLGGALLAGAVVWIGQIAAIPWRLNATGEIKLAGEAIVFGAVVSAVSHLLAFAALVLVTLIALRAGRLARARGSAEYWLLAAVSAAAIALVVDRQIFAAIAFSGYEARAVSVALAVMLTLVWSGVTRILLSGAGPGVGAVEAWLTPVPGIRSRAVSFAVLGTLVFFEYRLLAYVAPFDWDFVLLKLCVLAVWFLTFAYGFGALANAGRPLGWRATAAPAFLGAVLFAGSAAGQSRVSGWLDDPEFVPEFALEGYVAVDPSYRLIHDALRVESREDAEFYAHLRAHSLIQHVSVAPIDVDFIRPAVLDRREGQVAGGEGRPHIFLFVIDSLRRDYLSPYNPAVTFTPAIDEFAGDSVVFERAYTRYGGTGLAVPAIWAGGMLLHKQYVTPFGPMNALLKMLEADRYRRLMSMDSIVVQLMAPPPPDDELDRGVHIMSYRLCGTLEDLMGKLDERPVADGRQRGQRPVFAYSLPQDLHISHIRSRPVRADASYRGFFPQVAAQVEEMDACFGRFVGFLKERGLYESSVIVITSDHGDSLGEGLRWGHSYTMFPEVARIPMIVRVPERFRRGWVADPQAVAFSTDLTPTFYALAGHSPEDLGPLYGRPLFVPDGDDLSSRRNDPQLIASSYGGVYAVLRHDGTRLYIADGVNKREYAYELGPQSARRVGVAPVERAANRRFIRQQIDDLARRYRFEPPS